MSGIPEALSVKRVQSTLLVELTLLVQCACFTLSPIVL